MNIINELFENLNEADRRFCEPLINKLFELGYIPKKHKKNNFAVKFEKYGRIIAKFEIGQYGKLKFHMRFSACSHYPEIFAEAASYRSAAWVKRNQYWENHDTANCCRLCKGNPRLYHVVQENGTTVDTCGGFTKQIHNVGEKDVPDIIRMLEEQDLYFEETFSQLS